MTYIYLLGSLMFIIYLLCMIYYLYCKHKDQDKKEPSKEINQQITQEQYAEMLNMLLGLGVIDNKQYNQLMVKGIPLFKP